MAISFYFKLFCCSLTSKQRHRYKIKPKPRKSYKCVFWQDINFFRSLLFCRLDLYDATEWLEDWMKIVLIAQNGSKSITTEKWVFLNDFISSKLHVWSDNFDFLIFCSVPLRLFVQRGDSWICFRKWRRKIYLSSKQNVYIYENSKRVGEIYVLWIFSLLGFISLRFYIPTNSIFDSNVKASL